MQNELLNQKPQSILLTFKTKAKPKQSARFASVLVKNAIHHHKNFDGRTMTAGEFRSSISKKKSGASIVSFQDKSTTSYAKMIMWEAKAQLPKSFRKLAGPVMIEVTYRYKMPKIFTTALRALVHGGGIIYKITRPDLHDNMNKGIIDAISDLIFNDDAQVAVFHARKIYAAHDEIEMLITPL